MNTIYLDNAATTPLSPEVIKAMTQVLTENYGNPSSTHQLGRKAKALVEQVRKDIAKQFKVSAGEIFFTAGGTEADNTVLRSAVNNLGVSRIISSKIEHHAVLHTLEDLKEKNAIQIDFVKLDANGAIDLEHLEALLQDKKQKTLVSLMHVNNEIGNLLALEKVAQLCQEYQALFHSDTVQGVAHFDYDLSQLPLDFLAVSAHKFHGPKGVGFLFARKGSKIKGLLTGGEQERGLRAGTESVHNIVGLGTAFKEAYKNLTEETAHISNLKRYFIKNLNENFEVAYNGNSGDLDKSSHTILNVRFPQSQNKMLLFTLDMKGLAVSEGSACQSGAHLGSHVLQEVLTPTQLNQASLRFSFSKYTSYEALDKALIILKESL